MLKIKKIVCPTDFSEPSLKGLAYAVEMAKAFRAELRVVYVLPIVPASATSRTFIMRSPNTSA
jgi:nucleotide-binding universal stress UspA family protein